jgi:receptor protein-tyrosine kinase
MTDDEGKMYRALRKSGNQDSPAPGPEPETEAAGPLSRAREVSTERGDSADIQRVPATASTPDYSVIMLHDKLGEAASQIRAIRAKMLGSGEEDPPQVITITSGTRGEGKTTIAVNLAVALSEADEGRTVIVDADLRGASVHRLANIQPERGMDNILQNGMCLDGNVYETCMERVDIIPSYAAHELDGRQGVVAQRCQELLRKLRRHYSYVIVDTAPVLASDEARVFGRHSDGTVLVARLEKTPREVVKRAADELRNSGARVIGCVLTHRRHHVPNFIYALMGHTPNSYYYHYGRDRRKDKAEEQNREPAQH